MHFYLVFSRIEFVRRNDLLKEKTNRTNYIKLSLNDLELKKVYELLDLPTDNTLLAKEIRKYLLNEYDKKKGKKNDV